MKFRAIVELGGKTATGIIVPPEIVAALGSSKRPAVQVTINGHTYRSTVTPLGGAFMLPVRAEVRAAAGIAAGDEVEVDVELDTAPRELVVPDEFSAALDAPPAATPRAERSDNVSARSRHRVLELPPHDPPRRTSRRRGPATHAARRTKAEAPRNRRGRERGAL